MQELAGVPEVVAYLEAHHPEIRAHAVRSPTGNDWVALTVEIAPAAQLRPRSVMVANTDLPIGGVAVVGEWAVLRQTLPLARLDTAQLAHASRALAILARHLRHVATVDDATLDMPYAFIFR